jgi:phosphoglucosamine mutase
MCELQQAIREAETELGDNGRVLIRYSGTQSMCRVMVEGPTDQLTNQLTHALAEMVRKCIG